MLFRRQTNCRAAQCGGAGGVRFESLLEQPVVVVMRNLRLSAGAVGMPRPGRNVSTTHQRQAVRTGRGGAAGVEHVAYEVWIKTVRRQLFSRRK